MTSRKASLKSGAFRLLWIVPIVLVLLYATAAISLANVAYRSAPAMVLKLYPFHGPALGSAASDSSVRNLGNADDGRTRKLAERALRFSGTTTSALRALALQAEGQRDIARARRLMDFAFDLNRRDLPITMWLIEAEVRDDDLPDTLHLYDVALRTSREAEGILLPTLVKSAENNWMLPYLAQTLSLDPLWGNQFAKLLVDADIPATNKVALAERLRGSRWFGAPFRHELVSNLVADDEFMLAAHVTGKASDFDRELGDAFTIATGAGPFNWKLSAGYQIDTAFRDSDGGRSMGVLMDPEYNGTVARVLMLLPEGSYRLASRPAGRLPANVEAAWTVNCAQRGGQLLARLDLSSGRSVAAFGVGPNCPAQWLTLDATTTTDESGGDVEFEIANLSVTRQ